MAQILRAFLCLLQLSSVLSEDTLVNFKLCSSARGIAISENFIERSTNSTTYHELNYQIQLRPYIFLPLAYLLVESEEDVANAVICGRIYNVHIVPKCGGHSFEKYSFGNSESVILDLRRLITFVVNEANMTARVGAGHLLGSLYYKLWMAGGYAIASGACPTVGISGITLAGGIGFYSRKHGATADNLLSLRVVTADGAIRSVTPNSYPDLWWALRGAGVSGSFGIVTEFQFKLFKPSPVVSVTHLTYPLSAFSQVFNVWQILLTNAKNSANFILEIANRETLEINITDIDGDESEAIRMQTFLKNSTLLDFSHRRLSYAQLTFIEPKNYRYAKLLENYKLEVPSDILNITLQSMAQTYCKQKSFIVTQLISPENMQKLGQLLQNRPNNTSFQCEMKTMPHHNTTNETSCLQHSRQLYECKIGYSSFEKKLNTAVGLEWVSNFYEFTKYAFSHNETYQGFTDEDLADYLNRYYGQALPRLIQIKSIYDPSNYFYQPQSIPPNTTQNLY